MAKRSPLPWLLGLGVVAAAATAFGKSAAPLVTGKSGKSWRVALLSTSGNDKTWEVFAPASSFGPHAELSALRYTQTGSDISSRKVAAVPSGVPAVIITTAASDFGVPLDASLIPSS